MIDALRHLTHATGSENPFASALVCLCSSLGIVYAAYLYIDYRRLIHRLGNLPGFTTFPQPLSILQGINEKGLGKDPFIVVKYQPFQDAGCDAVAWVSVWPKARLSYALADPDAIKDVTSDRTRFVKPSECYTAINVFGENIVSSEGETWKRHRRIMAPAFSEKQYQLVWKETAIIMDELIDRVWNSAPEVVIHDAKDITMPAAIMVISAAGFGQRISWYDEDQIPEGHRMTFRDALVKMSPELITLMAIPSWAMGLTAKFRAARLAASEIHKYMLEMIAERRHKQSDGSGHDIFTLLMEAMDDDDVKVTERELTGNVFVLLLAGHETTAHTLAFTLAFLALYPETQEHIFREIQSITDNFQRELSFSDMGSLTYTMAVFYETLRLMPSATYIPKRCTEDTSLAVANLKGGKTVIPISAGTYILMDLMGLHYNPRVWPDPYSFKPERFLGEWNRDAFMAFNTGPRGCTGRKFAETEVTVILTKIVAQYTIAITENPTCPEESFEQRKARVFTIEPGITTTPARIPLTLRRRD
ncbi:unnamed protein product [Peniophora sp. CBMAI 1063]|nr:unnamed protein product [Peniophora sp. CBMAI 1063]